MSIDMVTNNIQVRMEQYRTGLISARISRAIWRFDEEGRLIDILVDVGDYQLYGWY